MTKSKTQKFWITTMVFALVTSGVLFFPQTSIVRALFGKEHVAEVLLRFWNEVLPKSEAGRYYRSLAEKHADELFQILQSHKEHRDKEFLQTIQLFIPGLEALLDGKGDTVQITEEQISSLKAEVDWIYSFASPVLQKDIAQELQRFPLENFIGMTMSEALDHVTSNFPPDLTAEPIIPNTAVATYVNPTPVCLIGLDVSCHEKPLLAHDSSSQWAYYVHHGVYFEYPADWQVQYYSYSQIDEFTFLRQPGSTDGGSIRRLAFTFLDLQNAPIENWDQVLPSLLSQRACSDTQWKSIHVPDFQGFECFWKDPNLPVGTFNIFLYNENQRMAIDLKANGEDQELLETTDDLNAINEIFPNIQHIIESIRILKP